MPADELVRFVDDWGKRHNTLETGSRLVVVGSTDWSQSGKDLMLVHTVS